MSELKERIPEASESFGRLRMAPAAKADKYAEEVHEIMTALGLEKRYFISDQSTFSDFGLNEDELIELSDKLGIMVIASDYVAEIAERMFWAAQPQAQE